MRQPLSSEVARGSARPVGAGLRHHVIALLVMPALAATLTLPCAVVRAQDATWLASPGSGDFNTAANWTPATVPTGTASFGTSNTTALSFSAISTTLGGWTFNAGASAYTFTNDHTLTFNGFGINGGSPTITNNAIGSIEFRNSSTAGSAIITNSGGLFFYNGSGAGSATITNGNTLQFHDTSTAGSAIITNSGDLFFYNSSTAGSAIITNNSGGTTYFADSPSGGTGRFILNGTGALDFSDLTSGGTTAGSIEGDGKVFLGVSNLAVGGNNLSTTFSGVIQDGGFLGGIGGSLTKTGSGTLTLTGTNTYTGATAVDGGTLVVDGWNASSSALTVNSGGTVGGTGTLPSTTIASGGTLSPGNSIGTITVNGNLTFNAGSSYAVQVSPSDADRTNVTGSAMLAGTVNATFAPGSYMARNYIIVSATGGLGGTTFDALTTSNLPVNFDANLSYTATDALLNLTAMLGVNQGLGGNQQNVADALSRFFNNGGALPPGFATLFFLTGGNLSNALSQVSGEAATSAQQTAFGLMSQFLGLMLDADGDGRGGVGGPANAFAAEPPAAFPAEVAQAYAAVFKAPPARTPSFERRWSAWGSAFGGYNRTNGDPAVTGSHDLSARDWGFASGLDYRVGPDTVLGLALAGAGTRWDLAQGLGGGRSDAFQAGLYGKRYFGAAYVSAALAFANHWMSTDRFAFAGDHLAADFNAQSYGGRIEVGYRFAMPMVAVTPYAALQAQSFHTPSYSEADLTGAGFALAYNSRSARDTRSELGARFDHVAAVGAASLLLLRGRLAWAHDWVSDPTLTAAFQALPGASFIVNGATPATDSALVSAGAELRLVNGVSLLAKFGGEFGNGSQTYSGTATLSYTW